MIKARTDLVPKQRKKIIEKATQVKNRSIIFLSDSVAVKTLENRYKHMNCAVALNAGK